MLSTSNKLCEKKRRAPIYFFQITVDALCDLVPFVQFKRREKYSWRSVTLSKVAAF